MRIRRVRRYGTIIADPPWPERGGGRIVRGAQRHYDLMTVARIMATPVEYRWAADDCHLYLWVTNNFLMAGLSTLHWWGFRYVTTLTWNKNGIGLGQYFRGNTEHVLFGVRGNPGYRQLPNGKRAQGRTGFYAEKGEHSEKPMQIHEWAEIVSPGPRIELFARSRRPGWHAWGNEV